MKPIFIYSDKFLNLISWFMRVGGITLFPFVILREKYKHGYLRSFKIKNHETIHIKQQLELLVIPFYIIYLIEFVIKLFYYGNSKKAYKAISFEREAFDNEENFRYTLHRKNYSWIKQIFKK